MKASGFVNITHINVSWNLKCIFTQREDFVPITNNEITFGRELRNNINNYRDYGNLSLTSCNYIAKLSLIILNLRYAAGKHNKIN